MTTYSDKYLFEFETRSGQTTATQLQKISQNAAAAAKAITALAAAFNSLNAVMGRTPSGGSLDALKKVQVVNAPGAGQVNVNQDMSTRSVGASTAGVVAKAESEAQAAVDKVQSKYLRTTAQRIGDYTKFWLIGYGINQVVMTASAALEQWGASQMVLSDIMANFEISLKTTGDEAQRYTEKVLEISRATGISISEVGPGLVIQERVKGAPADLTEKAAEVQRVTGADNYSVERDLLSLAKQFPDESMVTILDAFTGAMRRSSLSAAEFFGLLESSGPLARQFNTSMEVVFGVFAGLSTATGESGQSIELFMRQMERVYTDAGTRSMVEKNIGPVSYTDPKSGYEVRRPWDEIMGEISKLSKDAQDEIAGTIPNMLGQQTRQIFLAMMKDWQGGITDAIGGAKNATGEFERSVEVMSDTWSAKTQSMKTAWESFLATIGGSKATMQFVSGITRDLNYQAMTNVAMPYIRKYDAEANKGRSEAAMREERGTEPNALAKFDAAHFSAQELYKRDTGLEATALTYTTIGQPPREMPTPEFLKWAPENLNKYAKQLQGDTSPATQTEWQRRRDEAQNVNGLLMRNPTAVAASGAMPDTLITMLPEAISQGFRMADERRQYQAPVPGAMQSTLAGKGLATTYLEDQKLTLDKGVTPDAVLAEIAKVRAERIASMRALEEPDALTGKMNRPYADATKTSDEMLLKIAGGLDTKSPLLLQDKSGNALAGIIDNAQFAAIAIKNLGDAAQGKATTIKSDVSSADWFGGVGARVQKEYDRLVGQEVSTARKNKPELAGLDDEAVKTAIGISKDYVEITSTVGTTLANTTVDAGIFAAAVANVGSAMAKLSYFDQPEWMGESDYVRRLNQYSQKNIAIQQAEGTYQGDAVTQRYVGPSGKAYDVFGNQESLAQGTKGIAGDDRQYQNSIAAANKGNALLEKIHSAIQSMVGELLQPTTVTEGDMAAAKTGTYTDKWDEPVRRIQDVVDRMKSGNSDLGPWKGYAEGLGINLTNKDTAMATGADFNRRFYNGMMTPEFYDQNSKEGFLAAARAKIDEKQGQSKLQGQAEGWLKEAGISDDMAKLVSREMSGGVSPMESYWRGGKTDAELNQDMKALGGTTVDKGITPGIQTALKDADPIGVFVAAWGMDKKESVEAVYKLGEAIGSTMVGGVASAIAEAILPTVTAQVIVKVIAALNGG
jgi:hypothetical protein